MVVILRSHGSEVRAYNALAFDSRCYRKSLDIKNYNKGASRYIYSQLRQASMVVLAVAVVMVGSQGAQGKQVGKEDWFRLTT
jgi:hypothetical protein